MDCCCSPTKIDSDRFRKAIQIALILNLLMFFVEIIISLLARSSALKADAIDFLGDSANYIISLYVLNRATKIRSTASLIKGITMSLFALWVLIDVAIKISKGVMPDATAIGWTGLLAFVVNLSVALMLYKFREGDSNMQSVWLCSRNDAIGNLAVIISAIFVYYLGSSWPDLLVAILMGLLSAYSGMRIILLAKSELGGDVDSCKSND